MRYADEEGLTAPQHTARSHPRVSEHLATLPAYSFVLLIRSLIWFVSLFLIVRARALLDLLCASLLVCMGERERASERETETETETEREREREREKEQKVRVDRVKIHTCNCKNREAE